MQSIHHRPSKFYLPLLLGLCLHFQGCGYTPIDSAPQPSPTAVVEPSSLPREAAIPAQGKGASLYAKARQCMTQGKYYEAELSLERALRIEPRNGYYWHALAETKYRQAKYSQAIQLALKSKTMAGGDAALLRLNDELITAADSAKQD